jgi:hypothetical protein
MISAASQQIMRSYADAQARPLLRNTPFYKPVGKFPDFSVEDGEFLDGLGNSPSKSLYIGRLLLACYENEFIYVPDDPTQLDLDVWRAHYSDEKLFQSHCIRHLCERPYFEDFRRGIDVTGDWSLRSFEDYFSDYTANLNCSDARAIVERIYASKSPHHAAKFHAIQLAAEFLVEASGMTRNLQGYFGPEQSEYFKIVTDEYGYGVFSTKHSTLYKAFVESVGLNSRPHHYWWFYLPATFFADNYINMLSTNHRNFFNHLGSLTQNENAFAVALKFFDEMYRDLFPAAVTDYFKEHVHIDSHHGRMAFEGLCLSLVRRVGDHLIPEIVRGFEESMCLGRMYRQEIVSHLDWFDAIWPEVKISDHDKLVGDPNFSTTMVDRASALTVEGGTVLVHVMPQVYRPVRSGETLEIPAHTLFGIVAEKGSRYELTPRSETAKCHGSDIQY